VAETLLKVENLVVNYGAIRALRGVSFDVGEGEIITLIGANGAGKSTTLHAISNIIKKTSGTVVFDGREISAVPPDRIVASGLVQVPEGRRIFANLSVRDNLEMGAYTRRAVTASEKHAIKKDMEKVFDIFPRQRARAPGCGDPVRRGAADACNGPRADGPTSFAAP